MRGRWLLALAATTIVVVGAIVMMSVARSVPGIAERPTVGLDVSNLYPGDVTEVETTRSYGIRTVFVADVPGVGLRAFLARDTHSGCRIRWTGDPDYEPFTNSIRVSFEDPCHGSVYALDGSCVGGPCPRDLDGFVVDVDDHTALVDVGHLVRGARRGTSGPVVD